MLVKIVFLCPKLSFAGGKIGSLAFAEGLALRVGAKANVPMRVGLKLFLKNAGEEKIKNIAWAMSVGLLVVRFQYDLYVVVHLSKLITLFRVNVCCVVSFYACCQRFAATRSWRFRRRKLSASTELDTRYKTSFKH